MATTPRPYNATPQRLNLKPPTYPRMPFSSPMGEEIMSPTSDPSHTPPQEQKERTEQSKEDMDNILPLKEHKRESLGQRKFSPHRSTKGDHDSSRNESPSRSKWPRLNVITDFSKGVDTVANLTKPKPPPRVLEVGQRHDRNGKTHGYPTPSPDPRNGHQRPGKYLKTSGSKGRLDDLKRASSKLSNLSPSDRAVMIGISIPEEEINRRNISPGVQRSLGSEQNPRGRRPSITPSVAPSIVITPAQEDAPWSASGKDDLSPLRPRAASSVYSHAPLLRDGVIDSGVPPVPPLPPAAQQHTNNEYDEEKEKEARIKSTCTIFDEEPSPETASHSRPVSRESQLQILKKSTSLDTIATRHRSQGWWNVLVSPFLLKSPINLKFQQHSPDAIVPPVPPTPTIFSLPGHDRNVDESEKERLSQRRNSPDQISAHTSFTDSSLEADGEKRALSFGEPIVTQRSRVEQPHTAMPRESMFLPPKFEGLGAASEYFEACLYDMHSTTPYFECQNHVCRLSTLGLDSGARDLGVLEAPPIARGLGFGDTAGERNAQVGDPKSHAALQVPTNRFSAAFHEAMGSGPKDRPESGATMIEDLDTTPDVQEAKVAPIVRAPQPVPTVQAMPKTGTPHAGYTRMPEESEFFTEVEPVPKALPMPPPRAPEKDSREGGRHLGSEKPAKRFVAVLPPDPRPRLYEEPPSPMPVSPGVVKQVPRGAIPLEEMQQEGEPSRDELARAPQNVYVANHYYRTPDSHNSSGRTTAADLWPPPRPPQVARWYEDNWKSEEKYELPPREPKKTRKLLGLTKCFQHRQKPTEEKEDKKKRRRLLIIVALVLLLLIILILVLAMTLTRKGDKMAVQSNWLNMTGYPPIPTGISTVAQPDAVHEEPGCVQPKTMWSCALPKEEQQGISPNAPNQPNFRVEIRFQNGTNVSSVNSSNVNARSLRSSNALSASDFVRHKILQLRSTLASDLYSPSPSPPSQEDQTFLGNTTDGIHGPFDGEYTPFFMTFQSPAPLPQLSKRQDTSSYTKRATNGTSSDPFPDLTKAIPPPSTNPDGTASPALLYPYPSAQPLRLYDRDLPSEHYGFYTYFDRSIFLKSTAPINTSSITGNEETAVPDDQNGGAYENAAGVRCTWAETRFLVQIWTKKGGSNGTNPYPLLQSSNSSTQDPAGPNSSSNTNSSSANLTTSSANILTRPGSFPYPITLTLDRHGGDLNKKMIYCYGLDAYEKPIPDQKKVQLEDRAFGGGGGAALVNPALGPFGTVNVTDKEGGPGGIDGGKGGCGCVWQNWR